MPTTFYPLIGPEGIQSQIARGNLNLGDYEHHLSLFRAPSNQTTQTITSNTNNGDGFALSLINDGLTSANFLTKPLNSFTMTGNVTFRFWASESNNLANAVIQVVLYRQSEVDGAALIGSTFMRTELTTTNAGYFITLGPTSTSFITGDRIQYYFAQFPAPGLTLGSNRTISLVLNSPTANVSGDTYATFTEDITLQDKIRFFPVS